MPRLAEMTYQGGKKHEASTASPVWAGIHNRNNHCPSGCHSRNLKGGENHDYHVR